MGHGAARTLDTGDAEERPLNPEFVARLDAAMEKLDKLDANFRAKRDEERFAQTTKIWNRVCSEVDGHLRALAKVLINSHQLNLDIGSEGGGQNTKPFMEELGGVLERLLIKLDGQKALAVCGARTIGAVPLKDVSYEWVEAMVVEWVVSSAEAKK